ncbi:unnamed protein product [Owenia fusiformis]|uniref:Uncharacterized protein n=1 Tax=Owenia fusiformis TaxID=6347 RepID=A0A8J1UEF8_OWEFU|nr:unnamed protein product [Owenia fusiformis]
MSLRTRIRGFTAWVNLRLKAHDHLMNNVLMDLMTGTNMKELVESMTGRDFKQLQSFDGLSQMQKITRVEWILRELQTCNIVPGDMFIDARLFAMRSADQIFELLWRLVSHDIWFVWERAEFLQHKDDDILCEVPFKWTPDPPPKSAKKKTRRKQSLLSGFGASSFIEEKLSGDEQNDSPPPPKWDPYPGAMKMKQYKQNRPAPGNYPRPDECIFELVQTHLKMTREGRKLVCESIDDFVDSRVLCALLNSFVPNIFTTEVLLNDKWTINLVLKTAEKMFYADSPFNSEDLVEADPMSVCSYFTFFFLVAYKYRQAVAVINRMEWLQRLVRECLHELDQFPQIVSNMEEMNRRKELKQEIEMHREDIEVIRKQYDVDFCEKWRDHVKDVVKETHKIVREKIQQRFDVVKVPRNITINDMCLSMVINLTLTNGAGFYLCDSKELCGEGRRIVLRNKKTGEFLDDFTSKNKVSVRKLLRLKQYDVVEVNPDHYPEYEIFFEAPSRNKQLKHGSYFLYQVFPGNTINWQHQFIMAAKSNEFDIVEKMVVFFKSHPSFINAREPKTGNSALHWACRLGYEKIVQYLLENFANIDLKNRHKLTPLFLAVEGIHRNICHLLIEWGCDMHCMNMKQETVLDSTKNDEVKRFLADTYDYYSGVVPNIMKGNQNAMEKTIRNHSNGIYELRNLRSRMINGSTLLHTAAYFGQVPAVKDLLQLRLDVNLSDYKGATPLHRARNVDIMRILLDAGALTNADDTEGNTALHVKCYGETGEPSEVQAVELLIACGASLILRNNRSLMPIHCAAMQGRIDLIKSMMKSHKCDQMMECLNSEDAKSPPSLVHLAVANGYLEAADWLVSTGFLFKDGEQDTLMQRILSEQIKPDNRMGAAKFLLEHDANPNPRYPNGNSGLHYAASMSGNTDVLDLLLDYGADIDGYNDDLSTPLFFATQTNNQFAASVLVERGANVRTKNSQGLTAFDCILDYDEWINCGYFSEEIRARLKAYSLKHARDLVRAISKKVKPNYNFIRNDLHLTQSAPNLGIQALPTTSLPVVQMQDSRINFFETGGRKSVPLDSRGSYPRILPPL